MVEGLYYPQTRTVDVTLCATSAATHPTAARPSAAPGVSPVDTGPVAVIHAQVSAAVPVTPPGSSTASRGVCGRHEQCGGGGDLRRPTSVSAYQATVVRRSFADLSDSGAVVTGGSVRCTPNSHYKPTTTHLFDRVLFCECDRYTAWILGHSVACALLRRISPAVLTVVV